MLFGVTFMSFMDIGAKCIKLYTDQSAYKVAFIRSFIMSIGCYCHGRLIYKINPCSMTKPITKLMFWRSLFGSLAFIFELLAVYLLPISLAIVLVYTQPIFASVLGYFFMNEKLSKYDILGLIFSLFGAVF